MTGTVIVSQLGARMHYAVPRILAEHGLLARFYTDICATDGWPRLVNLAPTRLLPAAVRRLVGRVPRGVPQELTTTFPAFGARSAAWRMTIRDVRQETAHAIWAGSRFSRIVARQEFRDAAGVYGFSGDALELMQVARVAGLWAAVEQMIAPRDVVEDLVAREIADFPEWETGTENPYARTFARRERTEWALANIIICPSEFVRKQVIASGGPGERCVVIPYGVDSPRRYEPRPAHGGPLRVLTVGEVGLRKGSPYVVEAARRLGKTATFRMVGGTRISDRLRSEIGTAVELLGIVPRAEIATHYQWADVFLLPSICEGSATVVYEALAAGLPVICTENTGSVVRDGLDGFIVPCRDSQAIVEAIGTLARAPELRAAMSASALTRAADFTVERYGARLVAALSGLSVDHEGNKACA